jgi:hypothetical protein
LTDRHDWERKVGAVRAREFPHHKMRIDKGCSNETNISVYHPAQPQRLFIKYSNANEVIFHRISLAFDWMISNSRDQAENGIISSLRPSEVFMRIISRNLCRQIANKDRQYVRRQNVSMGMGHCDSPERFNGATAHVSKGSVVDDSIPIKSPVA